MSFNVETLRNDYTASLGAIDFTFSFPIYTKNDILVLSDGAVKVLDVDYVVMSGAGLLENLPIDSVPATGFVRFVVPRILGAKISLIPKQPITQRSQYSTEPYPPKRLERDFDKLAMMVRMLWERAQRSPGFAPESLINNIKVAEPEIGKRLGWSDDLLSIENFDPAPKGDTGAKGDPGDTGPPGAGSAPSVVHAPVTVAVPTSIIFGTGFTVTESSPNVATVDYASPTAGVPSGTVAMFAGATPPTGWLLCDGSNVSRTTYSDLFGVVGILYGAGDGATTFGLPNPKGRAAVARDAAQTEFATLGQVGGKKTHVLTVGELATHAHVINDPGHNHGGTGAGTHTHPLNGVTPSDTPTAGGPVIGLGDPSGGSTGPASSSVTIATATTGITNQSAGANTAHNNLQPYFVFNFIIKT